MLRATGTKCPAGTVQLSANFEPWILREGSLWAASLLAEPSTTLLDLGATSEESAASKQESGDVHNFGEYVGKLILCTNEHNCDILMDNQPTVSF